MKSILAAALLAGSALLAAPAAQAAPAFVPTGPMLHGGHHHRHQGHGHGYGGFGIGIGVGGGYVAPRPYWGVTGYTTQARTVVVGRDVHGHAVTQVQHVSVPVYGWVYPAAAYRPYVTPSVSLGFGYRW